MIRPSLRAASCSVLCAFAPLASAAEPGLDQRIQDWVAPYTDAVARLVFSSFRYGETDVPLILLWLIAVALFCTFYFRFINIRGFAHGFRLIRGDYSDPAHRGEVSHFQALATALSGTVGLGNIAGVALAVSVGGPGATFWMILAGFFGMASKFCECTLGVMYRRENPDGSVSGGPMFTLSRGIGENYPRLAGFGKALGVLFAVFCLGGAIGAGNLFQSNGAMQALVLITGGPTASWFADKGWLFGIVVAILVGVVVIGGIRTIANVTEKLVPFMAAIYMLCGLFVLISNYSAIPEAVLAIVYGAFTPQGVQGGALGVMLWGFRRAAFSNEAGVGSAAIAHSAVRTAHPVTEGLVALWEPFIDTVVICTMTALVIVVSGATQAAPGATGVQLTAAAFGTAAGWMPYMLAFACFLFAYSTMISYCYYGEKATAFLFGERKGAIMTYKIVFLLATVLGCVLDFRRIADFSDAVFFLMAIPNVIGIYLLAPVVKREMDAYFAKLASGEIKPYRERQEHLIPSP